MVDLNGHEAGNGGHGQGKPTAHRDSSTRRDGSRRRWIIRLFRVKTGLPSGVRVKTSHLLPLVLAIRARVPNCRICSTRKAT